MDRTGDLFNVFMTRDTRAPREIKYAHLNQLASRTTNSIHWVAAALERSIATGLTAAVILAISEHLWPAEWPANSLVCEGEQAAVSVVRQQAAFQNVSSGEGVKTLRCM